MHISAILIATVGILLAACGTSDRPNILLITIDTLRADRLGCHGFGLAHTPAIDRLAAEGVRCTDAVTAVPITMPAHSSIMTGLYPPAHGVRDNGNYALGPEAVTLAERLRDAGYRTGAFVSALVLARRYGLDQGFETYDDDLWAEDEPSLFMIRDRPAARTAARTLDWLKAWRRDESGKPFFAWVHFFDPHQPHDIRDIDLAALTPTSYDAEIAQADRGVGRVLDWLRRRNLLDDTLVVLTADHGESLGQHGEPTHGIFIYDATVRVPLIWRLPGTFQAGTTYDAPIRHIDIVPSVLRLLALPGGETTQGVDLVSALQARTPPPALSQYSEAHLAEEGFGMAPLSGIRHAGMKWIDAPRPELYDLRADPGELRNRYPEDAPSASALQRALADVTAESTGRALAAPTREIDHETAEMLRALGYLAPPEQRAEMAGMDPKDGMPLYAQLQEAREHAARNEWQAAGTSLEAILATTPENVTAHNLLALVAIRRGDVDEAERQYLLSLRYRPQQHRVEGALGALALRRGDLAAAESRFREALRITPNYVEAMSNLGFIDATRGDTASAQAWYERAVAVDPTYPHVYRRLADLYYERKDWPHALEYYRRVLTALPRYFDVIVQSGNTARFLGDTPAAERYYAEAGRVRPDSWIPPYNLACLRAINADQEGALASLRDAVALGFAAPALLEENEDFSSIRALPGWSELSQQVRVAAAAKPRPR